MFIHTSTCTIILDHALPHPALDIPLLVVNSHQSVNAGRGYGEGNIRTPQYRRMTLGGLGPLSSQRRGVVFTSLTASLKQTGGSFID